MGRRSLCLWDLILVMLVGFYSCGSCGGDRALAPLHAVGAAKVNWVLILYENCGFTDQHNGQKAASKGDGESGS